MALKILQVAAGFQNWGGTELHILNLSEQLMRRGHAVTVACRRGRWVEQQAKDRGLPTIAISVMRQQDWQDFAALRQHLRERQTDVMHVHWSTDVVVPGFAARMERVPVRVLSRHMPYPFKSRLGAFIYSRFLYTHVIGVSDSVRKTMIGCGVAPGDVRVIHHGTDVGSFSNTTLSHREARIAFGIPENHVAVGIVGRIAPEKGHAVLFQAVKLLGDRYPISIVVIGDGPDGPAMRELARELGIEDRTIFTGFRDDINNAMEALDIVTLPSVWDEPCSAVVQQAMALHKPVIGTRTGGTPEMIAEEEMGILIPPSDPGAMSDAIARLAGDAFLRRRMGIAGRQRVEEHFSLSVMTDKIEELYHSQYEKQRGKHVQTGTLGSLPR